jgi:hypothetical protein
MENTALTRSILLTIHQYIFGRFKPDFINISACQSYQYKPQTINIIVNIKNFAGPLSSHGVRTQETNIFTTVRTSNLNIKEVSPKDDN